MSNSSAGQGPVCHAYAMQPYRVTCCISLSVTLAMQSAFVPLLCTALTAAAVNKLSTEARMRE